MFLTYANDPAALAAIRELLVTFRHPTTARPYRPQRATLFLGPVYGDDRAVPYRAWPLAPARLQPPDPAQSTWAIVVTGDEWDALIKVSGPFLGQRFIKQNGRRYAAFLMPWLPGIDYTADVAAYGDPPPTAAGPAAAQP